MFLLLHDNAVNDSRCQCVYVCQYVSSLPQCIMLMHVAVRAIGTAIGTGRCQPEHFDLQTSLFSFWASIYENINGKGKQFCIFCGVVLLLWHSCMTAINYFEWKTRLISQEDEMATVPLRWEVSEHWNKGCVMYCTIWALFSHLTSKWNMFNF